jgi:membrane dipeptidase
VLIAGGDGLSLNQPDPGNPTHSALHTLDEVLNDIDESGGRLRVVTSNADLEQARSRGIFAVVLGLEGAQPLDNDIALLRTFWRLGVRLVGLTWNDRNAVASGVGEGPCAGGLSRFGAQVVEEMNRLSMPVDVSHLALPGVRDVLDVSQDPIIASHCNSRTLCDHVRNLPDELVRAIAERGGVIGVNFYPGFVGKNPTRLDVARHTRHLINVAGEDHVGLGPDFVDFAYQKRRKAPRFIAGDIGRAA